MDRGLAAYLAFVAGVTAVAAALIAPYYVLDALLVSYLAFFVGGRALSKGELPAWISRRRVQPRSRISQYAGLMRTGTPTLVDALALNPFVKAVVSQKNPRGLTDAELARLRATTVNYESSRPRRDVSGFAWPSKG